MKISHLKVQYLLIIFLTITLLALIIFRALDNTASIHQTLLKQLQQLDRNVHLLNEHILKSRPGLLKNSDEIIKIVKFIENKTQQLHSQKYLAQNKEHADSLYSLLETSQTLSNSVNQFLTNNTIINNSIRALPILIKKLSSDYFIDPRLTDQLLNSVYQYMLWPEARKKQQITDFITELEKKKSNENPKVAEILNFIKAHSILILSKTPLLNENLNSILNTPLTTTLIHLQDSANKNIIHSLRQNQYLEWIINIIAITLILFIFSFISILEKSRKKLAKETLFLNTLLNTISDGVVACSSTGDITLYNRAISQMHGIKDAEQIPKNWNKQCFLYDCNDHTPIRKQDSPLYRALNDEKIEHQEFIIRPVCKNAPKKIVSTQGSKIVDSQNNILGAVISIQDISERKAAEQKAKKTADEKRIISKLLELSYKPLDEFLQQSLLEIVSLEWLSILPKSGVFLTDNEGDSETLSLFCHYKLAPELLTLCAKVPFGHCLCGRAAEQKTIQFAHCVDHRHETQFAGMKEHGHYNVPILEDNKVLGVLVFYLAEGHQQQKHERKFLERVAYILSIGISRKYAENKAKFLAYHDTLTRLPNRLLLIDRLTQVIASSRRSKHFNALIYIDFDHFKHINDSLGHSVGDLLLKEISQRFIGIIREEDTVARLGGDEFVLLITELPNNYESATIELSHLINRLQKTIAKEFHLKGHRFYTSMSAGIVILNGEDDDLEKLLMQADTAMYQAKAEGRNTAQFFLPEMQEKALTRILLEKDLRLALSKQELILHYQPQMDTKGTLIGAEALLRWKHPEKNYISPIDFIPIAEETGLILDIGEFVLRDACQNIIRWQKCKTLKHIAVNVSPVQFRQQNYVDVVKKVLQETEVDPSKLTLELTEGILVENVADIITKMTALKKLGINFSVDDFGTGYSSLAYLKRFPLDQLKIDKSFVDDINVTENGHVIIETIIAMADRLGFSLIAEGVETKEQLNYLKASGCYHYQGYYFSRPLDAYKFTEKYIKTNLIPISV